MYVLVGLSSPLQCLGTPVDVNAWSLRSPSEMRADPRRSRNHILPAMSNSCSVWKPTSGRGPPRAKRCWARIGNPGIIYWRWGPSGRGGCGLWVWVWAGDHQRGWVWCGL